jgi:prevent-host-death family protein
MATVYSTYEAKARLSELLSRVRGGETIVITHRGEEIAELRPVKRAEGASAALQRLEDRGILSPVSAERRPLKPLARRPGALKRFLEERD